MISARASYFRLTPSPADLDVRRVTVEGRTPVMVATQRDGLSSFTGVSPSAVAPSVAPPPVCFRVLSTKTQRRRDEQHR